MYHNILSRSQQKIQVVTQRTPLLLTQSVRWVKSSKALARRRNAKIQEGGGCQGRLEKSKQKQIFLKMASLRN